MTEAPFQSPYRAIRREDDSTADDVHMLPLRRDPAAWLTAWYYAGLTAYAELARRLRAWLVDHRPQETGLNAEGERTREALERVREVIASYKEVSD
jgi:hypothetical protein